MLVETIPCDVVLRQLQRQPGAKGSKPFSLARRHSLPPKEVTLFRSDPNGELIPVKVDLGSTLSEEQQHAISAWRDAAFDGPGSPLVLGLGGKVEALRSWATDKGIGCMGSSKGRNSLPQSLSGLTSLHRRHLSALLPPVTKPTAATAATAGGKRKTRPSAAAEGTRAPELALKIHCDVNDAQSLLGAHIQSDSTDDSVLGGELVLDGFAGEEWEELARRRAQHRR